MRPPAVLSAAALLLALSLAGCASPAASGGSDAGSGPAQASATAVAPSSAPKSAANAKASAWLAAPCTLVTADMIQSALGISAGTPESKPDQLPPTCVFPGLGGSAQVSDDTALIQRNLSKPADAQPVAGADAGWSGASGLVVVKNGVGVSVTGMGMGTTPAQWNALASAIAAKL
jgi:hypothetical protein